MFLYGFFLSNGSSLFIYVNVKFNLNMKFDLYHAHVLLLPFHIHVIDG